MSHVRRAVILSGERGTGKTTLCLGLARRIGDAGGIVSPALFDDQGGKIGFECLAARSGVRWELGRVKPEAATGTKNENSTGKFLFDNTGIRRAIDLIVESIGRGDGLTLIDEIGPLELRGAGFAPILPLLAGAPDLILVVRPSLVDEVLTFVPDHSTRVFYLTSLNRETIDREITAFLNPDSN